MFGLFGYPVMTSFKSTLWDGTADYLIIGGGGGGGGTLDGGGGAGGYRTSWGTGADGTSGNSGGLSSLETALILSKETAYSITVGQGGEGGLGWGNTTNVAGHQGRTTSISGSDITTVTTTGGGRGSGHAQGALDDGGPGGSGGGGAANATNSPGGAGVSGEGSNGGNESVGSGSDVGGGLGGDSQITHRRRDTKTTFKLPHFLSQASPVPSNDDTDHHRQFSKDRGDSDESKYYAKTIRRYGVGQYVLISNHNLDEGSSCLVNRYGFPEGGGGALYSEQRRGPYIYLLAQVKSVHFGEDAQYYTVSRCDNEEDQRADAGWMEPITDPLGIEAAKIAAKKLCNGASTNVQSHSDSVFLSSLEKGTKRCIQGLCTGMSLLQRKIKDQAFKCLNGNRPYKISFKFTGVNFLVLSSIWYLYIDQFRLAFFSHSADFACAIVSW